MARTAQVVQRQTTEVFLSEQHVTADKAQSVIPPGYRQATLEEVTLRYRHDIDFRAELWNKGPAWTSQKGLRSSGYQEISEDGKHSSVSEYTFYNGLTPEKRSYHYSGSCSVAVYVRYRKLFVYADFGASLDARVAYVKDGHEVATPKSTTESIPKQLVRDAEREYNSNIVRPKAIDESEFAAIGKLIEFAKAQQRK